MLFQSIDSTLLIIKYLFNKNNIVNDDISVESFFESGKSFPQFVSMIFNKEIPSIIKDPKTALDKNNNNETALQFLFENNSYIKDIQPNYESFEDQQKLLSLILTKQCFTINHQEIIDKFNLIIQPLGIHIKNENDILKKSNLLYLLNVLTKGDVDIALENQSNFDDMLIKGFKKANVPLVIDKNSLDPLNQYQFFIQILIIYDIFLKKPKSTITNIQNDSKDQNSTETKIPEFLPNKNDQHQKKGKRKKKSHKNSMKHTKNKYAFNFYDNISADEEDTIIKNIIYKKNDPKKDQLFIKDHCQYIVQKHRENLIKFQKYQEEAILNMINIIGSKIGFNFKYICQTVENNSLPKFVMNFLKIESIENVKILKEDEYETKGLAEQEIYNIESVISFLKQKKNIFQILLFDFKNFNNIQNSAILFYKSFLDSFYIKATKKEMYERCEKILFSNSNYFLKFDNVVDFFDWKLYVFLLKFLECPKTYLNFDVDEKNLDGNYIFELFKKLKIPLIINGFIMNQKNLQFLVFYQLQIIFDAIDSINGSHHIIECIFNCLYKLKRLKNMNMKDLETKKKIFQLRNETNKQYLTQNFNLNEYKNENIYKNKEIIKLTTFKERKKNENQKNDEGGDDILSKNSHELKKCQTLYQYWNKPNPDFLYDDGILYNNKLAKQNQDKSKSDWMNYYSNLLKKMNKNEKSKIDKGFTYFKGPSFNYETKLYKIFYYDENINHWKFDSIIFNEFAQDKKINISNSKISFVFFMNSFEKDLIKINSNLINGLYPKLDINEEEDIDDDNIFVYALCDKNLAQLNYKIDFTNFEKSSIKPIFLLLHIPKNKENLPNLQNIIINIYIFLSSICNMQVVILNKDHYLNQINLMRTIHEINNEHFKQKIKISSSIEENNNKNDDNDNDDDEGEEEEDIWEEEDYNKIEIQQENEINFIYKNPVIIFLINEEKNEFDKEIEKTEPFLNFIHYLLPKNNILNWTMHMNIININNVDTYETFLENMNDILIDNYYLFQEIQSNFESIKSIEIKNGYFGFMYFKSPFREVEMRDKLYNRFLILKSSAKPNENSYSLLSKLQNEIFYISPSYDKFFISQCNIIISQIKNEENQINREKIRNELKISAESHLNYLKSSLNAKFYFTEKQLAIMKSSHSDFLQNEFFSIIQLICSEKTYNSIYIDNVDVLQNQIKNDQKLIEKIFMPFYQIIESRNKSKEQSLIENINEGTNYKMKETETMREIKVNVQENKDLRSEIEQDF